MLFIKLIGGSDDIAEREKMQKRMIPDWPEKYQLW